MRTRSEMVARVRRYVNDVTAQKFETAVIVGYLQDAANVLWEDLASDPWGRACLRHLTDWAAFEADCEIVPLPADCIRLEAVMVRWKDDDDRYTIIEHRDPESADVRSGTAALFGTSSANSHCMYWSDDVDHGMFSPATIRVWPALATVGEEKYRFRYIHRPQFPTTDTDTFRRPWAAQADFDNLPERCAEAVEYYAAAMIGCEELDDGKPVGAFGRLYRATFEALRTGVGTGPTRPARRFIRLGR